MNFKDIGSIIKTTYYNSEDDTAKDFVVPVLRLSKTYKRETYSFGSSILSLISNALNDVIKNGCKIYYIIGMEISEADVDAIERGLDESEEIIEKGIMAEFGNIENMIDELGQHRKDIYNHRLKTLSFLISKGILNVKIGFVTRNGRIRNPGKYKFHPKVMIFEDFDGNKIVANGSTNETLGGHSNNEESFDVFKSWNPGTEQYLETHIRKFDEFWENRASGIKTIEINKLIENNILRKYKPNFKSNEEISDIENKLNEILKNDIQKMTLEDVAENNEENVRIEDNIIEKKEIKLRKYQNDAIENWIKRGKKGIFEMATGTGKTFTALGCLKRVLEEEKKLICVISTPYGHLNRQWKDDTEKFGLNYQIIISDSSSSNWKKELANNILDIENDARDVLIIITTHSTFSSQYFIDHMKQCNCKLFLISDEVHGVGSEKRNLGLIEEYSMRLGLSATPKRYFDEDGTDIILSYFGESLHDKPTFEFSLYDAIHTINPDTGKTFLVPYEYKPYFVELTPEELENYINKSRTIAKAYYAATKEIDKNGYYQLLCILRQKIVVNASNKFIALSKILDDMKDVKNCLIYCSDKQLEKAIEILKNKDIRARRFTMEEGVKPKKEYGGLTERQFILSNFSSGTYQALVAIKVLDEGIDIPSAKNAIILANSGNPKEYIQRRGRVLRPSDGKEKAIIYDVTVIPKLNKTLAKTYISLERNIVRRELKRMKEFSLSAFNAKDCLEQIEKIELKYSDE